MKKEFKVGDRVAVYDQIVRKVGTVSKVRVNNTDSLEVEFRDDRGIYPTAYYHPKQCRRIIFKRRHSRTVWIAFKDGRASCVYLAQPPKMDDQEIVEFREVNRK